MTQDTIQNDRDLDVELDKLSRVCTRDCQYCECSRVTISGELVCIFFLMED